MENPLSLGDSCRFCYDMSRSGNTVTAGIRARPAKNNRSENTQQMYSTFAIASNDFEKDLRIIKGMFSGLEEMTPTENGFRFSDSAQLAAGWWFYDVVVTQDFAKKMFETVLPPEMHNMKGADLFVHDAILPVTLAILKN